MTGTPLDLTSFGSLLSVVGLLYWAVALGLLGLALWWPRWWWLKVTLAALVLGGFVYPVVKYTRDGKVAYAAAKAKLDAANAQFAMRCKTAGEKIHRTVDGVEGVVWMRWRPKETNFDDQFLLNDPYGHDCYAEECIERLLRVTKGVELNPQEAKQYAKGYRFVETIDPSDGKLYRYEGVIKLHPRWTPAAIEKEIRLTGKGITESDHNFFIERQPIEKFTARYGITWDDLSTKDDRHHWVAGSLLKAVDLQTNEVIAQRVGYLFERGLGSKVGFRSPWPIAQGNACPSITSELTTWTFATKILKPTTQGE
jgi:hypothetical protein